MQRGLIKPCMGGWCHLRGQCAHHQTPASRRAPAERLCDRGVERLMFFKPAPPERREG